MKKIWATVISILSVLCMIGVWSLVAHKLNASVIIPTPLEVLIALKDLFATKNFILDVGITVLRAFESFIVIVISGAIFGILAGVYKPIEMVFKPFVTLFKATPVMSIVLIAFLWFKTGQIPVFSAFLMAFPVMYVQVLDGMKNRGKELQQMCSVYKIEGKRKLIHYTIPSMIPSLVTGAKQSLSMIWKVIIAAEVLTIPSFGIGRSLHMAQIQIETAKVFAWTVVAIILTWLGDYLFSLLLKRVLRRSSV